ncbi:L-threonylcarbamoyladenylate synthase [Cytobacillus sp. IB215665]|uniref:L-threonylcarbamoyladenylate synthase n=1 Tax=Cytobacillus sp. IB215665 TaxID=3097357 RepID=UPI002A0C3167|nr:L-threonylcarbamoyladenylate synthase [Cytobacillus sp. IB215665]MDX8363680.1 L-threonylcarbamoyladenylate synthase [Cytobacillus sp. IB215665]
MSTKVWVVDDNMVNPQSYPHIKQAAQLLNQNEVVAFPTETVYGLGANALSDEAVTKIFTAKGRPSDNPLIVHIAEKKQLYDIAKNVSDVALKLIDYFWPGPLTIVLMKKDGISDKVTTGLRTVAVRMPNHEIALQLIRTSQLPIAAPSANLSGRPSPTSAKHVHDDLNGKIAGILDGGLTGVGVESTVLDCTGQIPVILRPGGITKEQLEEVVGKVDIDHALVEEGQTPKSPGMKYTHYAPQAPLFIVQGPSDFLQLNIDKRRASGKRVGVITTDENKHKYNADVVLSCGQRNDLYSVASNLYGVLRKFDDTQVDVILSESFPYEGIGHAIMNRLMKAAAHQTIKQK